LGRKILSLRKKGVRGGKRAKKGVMYLTGGNLRKGGISDL